MSIKQNGGVFGRNPTFNDVTIDGTLTFNGDIDIDSDLKVSGDLDVTGAANLASLNVTPGISSLSVVDTANSAVSYPVKVSHLPSGTTGNGLGVGIDFHIKNSTYSSIQQVATIEAVGISEGEIANDLVFKTKWQNALAERARFKGRGATAGVVDFRLSNGNVIMGTSGSGIDFSATAGTGTSELFAGTGTYGSQIGLYTKVGRVVHFQCWLQVSAHTGTGVTLINGLPFTSNASNAKGTANLNYFANLTISASNTAGLQVANGQTYLVLKEFPVGGGVAGSVAIDPNMQINFSGSYTV